MTAVQPVGGDHRGWAPADLAELVRARVADIEDLDAGLDEEVDEG